MRHGAPFALLLLCLSACKPAEEGRAKAIIGAVLIDGAGGPPVTDSVVIVSGGLIRAAVARSNIPIPAEADKINGAGSRRRAPARPDRRGAGTYKELRRQRQLPFSGIGHRLPGFLRG